MIPTQNITAEHAARKPRASGDDPEGGDVIAITVE